jgi:hypothetical protein
MAPASLAFFTSVAILVFLRGDLSEVLNLSPRARYFSYSLASAALEGLQDHRVDAVLLTERPGLHHLFITKIVLPQGWTRRSESRLCA